MNAVLECAVRGVVRFTGSLSLLCVALVVPSVASPYGQTNAGPTPSTVKVNLSEWKIQLDPAKVPAGAVVFEVTNAGTMPHAFEVEGRRLEKSTARIQPGARVTLKLDLPAGSYETYCPVGKGFHKMQGMTNRLAVGSTKPVSATKSKDAGTGALNTSRYDAPGGAAGETSSPRRASL